MKKIGSITPMWNQEMFIGPHFEMLSALDKNVVVMHEAPLRDYKQDHYIDDKPDNSEQILKDKFPNVEIYHSTYRGIFQSEVYNQCLQFVQDCDIVLRLDPDMVFEPEMFENFLIAIQDTDYDAYRINFAKCSVNYYMTGDFDHGLMDSLENDILAFNPHIEFTGIIDYPSDNQAILSNPDLFFFHHFRGWNKPKSTPPDWWQRPSVQKLIKEYGNNGDWHKCPAPVRTQMENWLNELATTYKSGPYIAK